MAAAETQKPSRLFDFLANYAAAHPKLMKRLGDRETESVEDKLESVEVREPVYITGLARSGSTILLELLSELPSVVTHRYRDFPLLHIPVWWNRFLDRAEKSDDAPIERYHKDRILITRQSPEAMEEILWMSFFEHLHDSRQLNVLDESTVNNDFAGFYRDHIRKLLMIRGGSRYLSKGNYNLSRLRYLREIFPDAHFVLPVRDPVNHIASLLKQHSLLSEEERKEPMVLRYMQQSGHFEFGLDRRPLNFGDSEMVARIESLWSDGKDIEGTALYWASLYDFLANELERDDDLRSRSLVIHYDDLCGNPAAMLEQIISACNLEADSEQLSELAARISPPDYYKVPFSDEDINLINRHTSSVHERIRALRIT